MSLYSALTYRPLELKQNYHKSTFFFKKKKDCVSNNVGPSLVLKKNKYPEIQLIIKKKGGTIISLS